MGTRFELVLEGESESRLRAAGEEAVREIRHWHDMLSCFDPGSLVSRVNAVAHERPVPVGPELMGLLVACRGVHEASGGAFDVAAGALMHAWGFREPWAPLDEARASVGMDLVELDEGACTVRFTRPGVRLDFGGVGKGAALDAAAGVLRDHGVASAFLHGGTSSVAAIGEPLLTPPTTPPPSPRGEGAGWSVAIAPPPGSGLSHHLVRLVNESLSVSAPHGRMSQEGVGHVMDPRSGSPVRGASTAAVVAPSAVSAEAWSTALLVLDDRPAGVPAAYTTILAGDGAWRVEVGSHD